MYARHCVPHHGPLEDGSLQRVGRVGLQEAAVATHRLLRQVPRQRLESLVDVDDWLACAAHGLGRVDAGDDHRETGSLHARAQEQLVEGGGERGRGPVVAADRVPARVRALFEPVRARGGCSPRLRSRAPQLLQALVGERGDGGVWVGVRGGIFFVLLLLVRVQAGEGRRLRRVHLAQSVCDEALESGQRQQATHAPWQAERVVLHLLSRSGGGKGVVVTRRFARGDNALSSHMGGSAARLLSCGLVLCRLVLRREAVD
mmetsp:Transcript_34432/g.85868  ORF Transcript_34432/g.85868 Transcript_34432/m.85868 type:complete len:259 (+) Transcript_34432:474-1250(+)